MRIFRPSGALWAHAGFMRLWAAQTVSAFGSRIAREGFAMSAILSIHATPGELGLLAALARGPGLVVGLFAGSIVDRSRRRRVMIASDLARTALILTVPLAAWLHVLSMMQLYAVAALVGAASVLFEIADHAFLPSLIEREHLLDGNAKLGVTDAVAEIGGPAMAGTLFQLLTPPFAMLGTAITYLVSAAFLFAVPACELPPKPSGARWHQDLAAGLRAVRGEPLVRPLLGMTVLFTGFGAFFGPLYLLYGIKVLGLSPALMGLTIACGGVGALFGASLSNALSRRIGVGPTVWGCCLAYTASLLLVPLAHGPLWLAAGMLMTAQLGGDGFAVAFLIPLTSLRQAVLPRAMLGRTAALFSTVSGGMSVLGAIAGGALANSIGIRETLLIAVAGMAGSALFVLFSPLRHLKEIPLKCTEREPI